MSSDKIDTMAVGLEKAGSVHVGPLEIPDPDANLTPEEREIEVRLEVWLPAFQFEAH
jgi:hypothetical protein